uniref:Transmembrane protein n=1 Tax=Marseillevirus LCMAC101 TaxID=2506602 RepID=A0A481YSE0_9VIRU|nr:MAG: hypothetical protein LCMAC101_07780 [Marseillevirus LCMAC101]
MDQFLLPGEGCNTIPWFMEIIALLEYYHVRLTRFFFPVMVALALLQYHSDKCQYILFFLVFCLVIESGTANVAYRYSKESFPIVYMGQHIIFFSAAIGKLSLSYFFVASDCSQAVYPKLVCWFIFIEYFLEFTIYLFMFLYLRRPEYSRIRDNYRKCRRMMENIKAFNILESY